MSKNARVLESKTIFRGRAVELKVDQVIEPGGVRTEREVTRRLQNQDITMLCFMGEHHTELKSASVSLEG